MSEIVFWGIKVSDWIMIFAVLSGPIASVQIQKFIEARKEAKERRVRVFKDLMATRASTLAYQHVSALNLVGLEFQGRAFIKVIGAWNLYLDHLSSYPKGDDSLEKLWGEKSNDLLSELLYEMGLSLGFEFDKVHIKKSGYIPKGYTDQEIEQSYIRKAFIEVLDGNRAVPMNIKSVPIDTEMTETQKELHQLLVKLYKDGSPFPVKIVENSGTYKD